MSERFHTPRETDLIERLREHPPKMEALADLFDAKFPGDPDPEVQADLREWAALMRDAASDLAALQEEVRDADAELGRDRGITKAISEGSNAAMKAALGTELYGRLWGPELEALGGVMDKFTARAVRSEAERDALREALAWAEIAMDTGARGWTHALSVGAVTEDNAVLVMYRNAVEKWKAARALLSSREGPTSWLPT